MATAQFNYGAGRMIISTFKLIDAYRGNDPVATIVLHNLLRHLAKGFDAKTSLPLATGDGSFVYRTLQRDNF